MPGSTRSKSAKRKRKSVARKPAPIRSRKAKKTVSKRASASASTKQEALVLVGTMKGAFILRSDKARKTWKMDGPYFKGEAVYALLHDTRGGHSRTYAAANSMHWGPTLRVSDDLGATWSEPANHTVRFPEEAGRAVAQIWQIAPGRPTEPNGSRHSSTFQTVT